MYELLQQPTTTVKKLAGSIGKVFAYSSYSKIYKQIDVKLFSVKSLLYHRRSSKKSKTGFYRQT